MADGICALLWILLVPMLIIGAVGLNCVAECCDEEQSKKGNIFLKRLLAIIIFDCLLLVAVPNTATVYKMLIIPTVVNSPIAQKLPDELQQFIDKELSVKKDDK